ncbi:MAG: hypothetical protein AABY53_08650 [Bdellovibrionota bacterium]
MDLIWIILAFFIFITILFVVLAVSFPEWFGITGNKARSIQQHQTEETDKDLTTKS